MSSFVLNGLGTGVMSGIFGTILKKACLAFRAFININMSIDFNIKPTKI